MKQNKIAFMIGFIIWCCGALYIDKILADEFFVKKSIEIDFLIGIGIIILFNFIVMTTFRVLFPIPREKTAHEILKEELRGKDD